MASPFNRSGLAGSQPTGTFALRLERSLGMTVVGVGLGGVVVVGYIVARILASRPMTFLVYGFLLLVLASVVMARRKLPLEAHRASLPTRAREGQRLEVSIAVTARRRVSSVVFEDEIPAEFGPAARLPVATIAAGAEVTHTYSFVPTLRGIYEIGPLVAVTGDAFGLSRRRIRLADPVRIIVHPRTESVHDRVLSREWEDPPVRPPVAKPWPTGFEFYGMRDYQPGDDPRRIMWRAAARTWDPEHGVSRYMVRESEQGVTDRVTLILDNEGRQHSRGRPSETFETAVRTCSSLGVKHLKDGFSVTAYTNGGEIAKGLRGNRAQIPFLDAMAAVSMSDVSLSGMMARIVASPRSHTHVVIIAPELSPDVAKSVRILLDGGSSVLIALVRWDESDPASVRRAGALGCNFVEIRPDHALDRVFAAIHGSGARR
jgi:uncharacterized protein (DUF58 family)